MTVVITITGPFLSDMTVVIALGGHCLRENTVVITIAGQVKLPSLCIFEDNVFIYMTDDITISDMTVAITLG